MRGKKQQDFGGKAGYRCDVIRQDAVAAQLTVQATRGQLAAAPTQAEPEPYEGLAGRRTRLIHERGAIATSYTLDPETNDPRRQV